MEDDPGVGEYILPKTWLGFRIKNVTFFRLAYWPFPGWASIVLCSSPYVLYPLQWIAHHVLRVQGSVYPLPPLTHFLVSSCISQLPSLLWRLQIHWVPGSVTVQGLPVHSVSMQHDRSLGLYAHPHHTCTHTEIYTCTCIYRHIHIDRCVHTHPAHRSFRNISGTTTPGILLNKTACQEKVYKTNLFLI